MSINREDPEIEAVLQRERDGSGNYKPSHHPLYDPSLDAAYKAILAEIVQDLTPRPGPNYYSFHEHRIYCENDRFKGVIDEAQRVLDELDA